MELNYLTPEKFERVLTEKWKLKRTDEGVPSARMWETPGKKMVLVPTMPRYPEHVLARIEQMLQKIGERPVPGWRPDSPSDTASTPARP